MCKNAIPGILMLSSPHAPEEAGAFRAELIPALLKSCNRVEGTSDYTIRHSKIRGFLKHADARLLSHLERGPMTDTAGNPSASLLSFSSASRLIMADILPVLDKLSIAFSIRQ